MAKFRKKPVVIDAVLFDGSNVDEINSFVGQELVKEIRDTGIDLWGKEHNMFNLTIPTLEGQHIASPGDWIIRGIENEYYPCKPDIFKKTYDVESVPEQAFDGSGVSPYKEDEVGMLPIFKPEDQLNLIDPKQATEALKKGLLVPGFSVDIRFRWNEKSTTLRIMVV